ncbi:MAG: 6-phosphogluconolactonase [Planctomycetota bacterium]|jgi:6-phosphogluconolactonase
MLKVFPDIETLSREAARFVAGVGIGAVYSKARFDLVLAGGRTPLGAYRELVAEFGHQLRLWKHTHVWWGDERCVPTEDPDSNYHSSRLALLMPLGIPDEQVHRIRAEIDDPAAAAAEYDEVFPAAPDLLMLGIGEDGHVASLFPGFPALAETGRRFTVAERCPKPPPLRITLTPPVISAAQRILVLASGARKAGAVRRAFAPEGNPELIPARLARSGLWMIDEAAASEFGS